MEISARAKFVQHNKKVLLSKMTLWEAVISAISLNGSAMIRIHINNDVTFFLYTLMLYNNH
jgi:hypothetical protein